MAGGRDAEVVHANLVGDLVLAVSVSAAAVVLVLFIVLRIRHRMTRRRREMDELAAMYENEDTE